MSSYLHAPKSTRAGAPGMRRANYAILSMVHVIKRLIVMIYTHMNNLVICYACSSSLLASAGDFMALQVDASVALGMDLRANFMDACSN